MPPRQRKPATVMGPTPVAPPAKSKYCTHATPPPTKLPPAPLALPAPEPVHHLADNEPS